MTVHQIEPPLNAIRAGFITTLLGEDGLSIARRLACTLPILMLSARSEEVDRILELEFGADDALAPTRYSR